MSWQEDLAAALGAPCRTVTRVATGAWTDAWQATCGDRRVFVKTAPAHHAALLGAEAAGLAALAATRTVRVPAVLAAGRADHHGWLALEWLDLATLRDGAAFARALVALHEATPPYAVHGWPQENFIGATPQANAPCPTWAAFWRERRLAPQLALAGRRGAGARLRDQGAALLEVVDVLLQGHEPAPSLLHGDLWGGNAGQLRHGTPVVFDPAVYVGDRETDLAMTELFGGFPPSFLAAYRDAWPLPPGYAVRRELYNLYHLLNHFNLFGAAYERQCEASIAHLLATAGAR